MQTPLLNALQDYMGSPAVPFHTPGHKLGAGIPDAIAFLKEAYRRDLPDLPGFDLFDRSGILGASQAEAARVYGADRSWYLVNGSTCGVIAALLATCGPGDRVLLPRNVHRSAISGVILAGLDPVFVLPEYDGVRDIMHPPTVGAIERSMAETPDIKAVLIVSPSYHGVCAEIRAIAKHVHSCGSCLIVDEAHGAHFGFHPGLPRSAIALGADLVVQSTHKTLGAMTQAAMLHLRGSRVDGDRVTQALQMLQSSSPSLLLLASLEAATHQMATQGVGLMEGALGLADRARRGLAGVPGIEVLAHDRLDPTRLTIFTAGLGLSGFALDELLSGTFGITAELPMAQHLTFILTFGNTASQIDRLVAAMAEIRPEEVLPLTLPFSLAIDRVMSLRSAFFAESCSVPVGEAVGRVCAELVCPYPPGIPVLMPGERVTGGAIDYLRGVIESGGYLSGCADESLGRLRVVSGV
ncbi:MAG: aminotransferase class V-fold PLP-dependent enzyme [Alkalinema sp. RU_4_3]|nr:aminotransferase class V-fold PLP-dependent enzyme [Alkalinema sp. RU_4_3]